MLWRFGGRGKAWNLVPVHPISRTFILDFLEFFHFFQFSAPHLSIFWPVLGLPRVSSSVSFRRHLSHPQFSDRQGVSYIDSGYRDGNPLPSPVGALRLQGIPNTFYNTNAPSTSAWTLPYIAWSINRKELYRRSFCNFFVKHAEYQSTHHGCA